MKGAGEDKSSPAEPPPVSRHAWRYLEMEGWVTAGVNPALSCN